MNWKSILILTAVSTVAFCATAFSPTGCVTRATVHAAPSVDFLLAHLARQYSNDMRSVTGRVKWHGKPVRQEIDATNRMCKIERYADGTVHVEPYRPPRPYDNLPFHAKTNHPAWKEAVVKRKAILAARRAAIEARRNVLPGLKDAQLKAFDSRNTESNVTVNVNIGGSRNGR